MKEKDEFYHVFSHNDILLYVHENHRKAFLTRVYEYGVISGLAFATFAFNNKTQEIIKMRYTFDNMLKETFITRKTEDLNKALAEFRTNG